jgi:hypothetical protein
MQNPYASNMSADSRRCHEVQELSSNGSDSDKPFGVDTDAMWATAKSWASTAGQKLQETEEEIWKRVGGGN